MYIFKYMSVFSGIINDNGYENKIQLYVDIENDSVYDTDFCVGNTRSVATIESNKIVTHDKIYYYNVRKCTGEVIIAGKEEPNIFHWILPCIYKQIFFVATNRQEV